LPTIAETFGLKKPLPITRQARAANMTDSFGTASRAWPSMKKKPPIITDRRYPSLVSARMPPNRGLA
jgi:hypothetical protein